MTYLTQKHAWKDELWNVSLLPAVSVSPRATPPSGPNDGSTALRSPALLSAAETVESPLRRAA